MNKLKLVPKSFYIFLVIGTITFTIDYLLYLIFLKAGIVMNLAKASSSFMAVLFNYFFNSKYNFGGQNKITTKYLAAYILLYSVLILVHVILNRNFYLLTKNEHVAVLLAMSISLFINYLSIRTFFSYIKK